MLFRKPAQGSTQHHGRCVMKAARGRHGRGEAKRRSFLHTNRGEPLPGPRPPPPPTSIWRNSWLSTRTANRPPHSPTGGGVPFPSCGCWVARVPASAPPPPTPLRHPSTPRRPARQVPRPTPPTAMGPGHAPVRGPRRSPGSGAREAQGADEAAAASAAAPRGGRARPGLRADVDTHHTMP